MKHRTEDWLGALFGVVVVVSCAASAIAGAAVVLQELITWLKTVVWVTPTLDEGLVSFFGPLPDALHTGTGYLGLDQIIEWALGSPLALWLIVIGPAVWFVVWTFALNMLWRALEPRLKAPRDKVIAGGQRLASAEPASASKPVPATNRPVQEKAPTAFLAALGPVSFWNRSRTRRTVNLEFRPGAAALMVGMGD
jgi:hypothetical protein